MIRVKIFLFYLLASAFTACTSGEEQRAARQMNQEEAIDSLHALQEEPNRKAEVPKGDTVKFELAFEQFFTALQTADTTMLNHFIHPELGVWLIEQPGAVPRMTRVTDIREFTREFQNRSFFTVAEDVQECDLVEEPFPSFDCANMDGSNSGYSKDGCFVWEPDKFRTSGYWNYASLSETQIDQVKATLPLVQRSVLHTGTSFEFHFGFVNQQWRLLFAKLIYPCSA